MSTFEQAIKDLTDAGWPIEVKRYDDQKKIVRYVDIDTNYPQIGEDFFNDFIQAMENTAGLNYRIPPGAKYFLFVNCTLEAFAIAAANFPQFPPPLHPPEPTGGMRVDFNNLRKKLCRTYEELAHILNKAILKNQQWAIPNDVRHGQEIDIEGYVLIDAQDLNDVMEDLRSQIGSVAMTYEEGREDFKDVYPQDKSLLIFNPEE